MAPSESMMSIENAFREATSGAKGLQNAALIALDKDGEWLSSVHLEVVESVTEFGCFVAQSFVRNLWNYDGTSC